MLTLLVMFVTVRYGVSNEVLCFGEIEKLNLVRSLATSYQRPALKYRPLVELQHDPEAYSSRKLGNFNRWRFNHMRRVPSIEQFYGRLVSDAIDGVRNKMRDIIVQLWN